MDNQSIEPPGITNAELVRRGEPSVGLQATTPVVVIPLDCSTLGTIHLLSDRLRKERAGTSTIDAGKAADVKLGMQTGMNPLPARLQVA